RPARLAVFAVVHDIDARFELALHDVAGRRAHGVIEFLNVVRIILRLRRELPQLRGADDAADVGREDTVVTASHGYSLQSGRLAAPQFAARDARALAERFELGPLDRRMNAADMRRLGEAAVGTAEHVLAADELGHAHEAFGRELRMLDHGGGMADDA